MLRKTLLATLCASVFLTTVPVASAATAQQYASEQGNLSVTPITQNLDHP